MKTSITLLASLAAPGLFFASSLAQSSPETAVAGADSAVEMEKFVVQSVATPTANTLADHSQIQLQTPASSVINVIRYLPGVNLSQGDALGSDDWSTHITIRGFNEAQLGFTLDGIANGFTGYGGGTKPNRYVDVENLSSVVVSQGAADLSSASSQALGGTLAYFTSDPSNSPGGLVNYTFGDFNASRAFLRLDTGKIGGNSEAYLSFSSLKTDNWVSSFVGGSSAVTKRLHLDLKDITRLGQTKLTVFVSVDNVNPEINYQGVSLQQFASDPRNDLLTFNWTGNPDIDQNYAQTWTTYRTNTLVYAKLETPISDQLHLSVQPYWHHQTGKGQFLPPYQIRRYDLAGNLVSLGDYQAPGKPSRIFFADGSGKDIAPADPVTGGVASNPASISTYTWLTSAQQAAAQRISSARFSRYQNDRFGANLAFAWDLAASNKLSFGLWTEDQERMRHRTWHAVLDPRVSSAYNAGDYVDQFRWKYRTLTNMLYVSDQYTMDHWVFTGGVKYFRVSLKDKESLLLPTGAPGYSTKLDSNSNLLPSLGVQYKLDESNEFFASFTRNFSAVPDSLLEAGAAGVDVSRVKPEKADNFDFGYRRATGNLALSATLYYIKYTDKLVSLSGLAAKDYTNGSSGVWTNIGGTESYGTEIAAHYRLPEGFGLLGSFSTTHATYTAGTPDGTITKGKRVVDTPSVIASYGLLYNAHGFDAGFIGKTTGKRYGTYDNDNAVGSLTVFDFNLGYTRRFTAANFIKSLTLGINVTNAFDKNYLSSVSIYDQGYVKSDPTGSTMLWNIGAPRTVTFTLGLGF